MKQKRIYCEAQQLSEEEFDKIPTKELIEMIGWVEPREDGYWDVMMCDESIFECGSQEIAHIIASNEEIKALLMKKSKGLKNE